MVSSNYWTLLYFEKRGLQVFKKSLLNLMVVVVLMVPAQKELPAFRNPLFQHSDCDPADQLQSLKLKMAKNVASEVAGGPQQESVPK